MKELKFKEDELIVSKTDTKGKITYGNELFLKLAGYDEMDILNKPHNIIRHPEMPRIVFKLLWDTVQSGKEIHAYVINKAKNGDYYWVLANVTPSFNNNRQIVGYYSVRRRPSERALAKIKPLYNQLRNAESTGGLEKAKQLLNEQLKPFGGRYDKFILSI